MAIGIGIGNCFKHGGFSFSQYWARQSEVLFFGLYSDISGGQMPNKVSGATDYLTVAGVAGSETYTCPNTATYKSADTDYVWFTSAAAQRTVTTAELIGYNFGRTFVKYLNDAPNTIEAILIFKSTATITQTIEDKLSKDFSLYMYYFNELNLNGFLKSNRPSKLWSPLHNGHYKWYNYLTGVTQVGGLVSAWADWLGSANPLLQAGADGIKPVLSADGILGDGADDFLKTAAFTWSQPEEVWMVIKQVTWTRYDRIFDGNTNDTMKFWQEDITPKLQVGIGGTSAKNANLAVNTWGIIRVLFNGVNSEFQINQTVTDVFDCGASNAGGFTLFARGLGASSWANAQVKDIILGNAASDTATKALIYNNLKEINGL